MKTESEHDTTLKAAGRIEAHLALRGESLAWGPLLLLSGDDGLRFEISMDVEDRTLDEVEAAVDRIGLAVQSAVLAATGSAARVVVEGWSYPNSPTTRLVTAGLEISYDVHAYVDREPDSSKRGTRAFEAVIVAEDSRLPELYEVFWLGVRALQTIAPVVGLWAFATILEDETEKDNLDHLESLIDQMAQDGFEVGSPAPDRNHNQIRAAAVHANPRNWMPRTEDVRWFHEAARQYLAWRAERGPSEGARRNMRRSPRHQPGPRR